MNIMQSDSKPKDSFIAKQSLKQQDLLDKHKCECGYTTSLRKNLLRHQREWCRIYQLLKDIRHVESKLTSYLVLLTQPPQLLTAQLTKHSKT